jgi:hypothetical protein
MRGFFCRWPVAGEKAERWPGATVSFVFCQFRGHDVPQSGSRGENLNLAQQKRREWLERLPP